MYSFPTFKKCFVPNCENNSRNAPNKLFLTVPYLKQRKLWFEAVGKPYKKCAKVQCCEDHFTLEEDTENYFRYKCTGCRLILKPTAVPHKFIEKPNRDVDHSQITIGTKKRIEAEALKYEAEKQRKVDEFLKSMSGPSKNSPPKKFSSPLKRYKITEVYVPSISVECSEEDVEVDIEQLIQTRIEGVIEPTSSYSGLP